MAERNVTTEHTRESGTGPLRFSDGVGVAVTVDVAAAAPAVWAVVADIDLPARFSEEFLGARWLDEPGVGARFVGSNRHPAIGEWEVTCFVRQYLPPSSFGWVTSDPDQPGARWSYEITVLTSTTTRLRHSLVLGPGPSGLTGALERFPDREHAVLERRLAEHAANMARVVVGIADAASSAGAS
jgi:hypothetical protein